MGLLSVQYKCGARSAAPAAEDVCRKHAFFGTIIVRRFSAVFAHPSPDRVQAVPSTEQFALRHFAFTVIPVFAAQRQKLFSPSARQGSAVAASRTRKAQSHVSFSAWNSMEQNRNTQAG
jgi:hypothetical protein